MGQRRRAERNHRGGHLRGYGHDIRSPDRGAEFNQRQPSASDHQRELRRMRSRERSSRERGLQLRLPAGGGGRRVGVCCGGRRRRGKLRCGLTAATHGIGVSGYASTPYNVAVGGTDFADTYQGTTVHIGARPTAPPTVRPSRTFRRSPGTTRARVRSWRSFSAFRLVMARAAFAEAAWRNKTVTLQWPRAAEDPAGAQPAFRRQIW